MSVPQSSHFVEGQPTVSTPPQKSPEPSLNCKNATEEVSATQPSDLPAATLTQRQTSLSSNLPASNLSHRHTTRGIHARFLYENPRFINEPIMHVLPQETSQSVGECMVWSKTGSEVKQPSVSRESGINSEIERFGGHTSLPPSFITSHQSSYSLPESGSYQLTRKKAHGHSNPIIPNFAVKCREKISFHHDYNSRLDPNEPPRGKLHGNFVWCKEDSSKD